MIENTLDAWWFRGNSVILQVKTFNGRNYGNIGYYCSSGAGDYRWCDLLEKDKGIIDSAR